MAFVGRVYGLACAKGICKNRTEFARLLDINPSSLSAAMGTRPEYLTDKLIGRIAAFATANGLSQDSIPDEPEAPSVLVIPYGARGGTIGDFLDGMEALPQAVVCTEYAIGRALYIAAARRELVLGRDFRACCIDENPETTTGPFLTHMHQDEFGIADGVVEVILGLLKDSGAPQRLIRVPAIYVEGHTL